jgi:hypothetical protein
MGSMEATRRASSNEPLKLESPSTTPHSSRHGTTCGWRIVVSAIIPWVSPACYDSVMRDLFVLFIHFIATLARLLVPMMRSLRRLFNQKSYLFIRGRLFRLLYEKRQP